MECKCTECKNSEEYTEIKYIMLPNGEDFYYSGLITYECKLDLRHECIKNNFKYFTTIKRKGL